MFLAANLAGLAPLLRRDDHDDHKKPIVIASQDDISGMETELKWIWFLLAILYTILITSALCKLYAYYFASRYQQEQILRSATAAQTSVTNENPFGDHAAASLGRVGSGRSGDVEMGNLQRVRSVRKSHETVPRYSSIASDVRVHVV